MELVRGPEVSEVLPPEPASVARARRLIEAALIGAGHDDLVDDARLLVSEVVTNSVLHAGTDMRLRCELTPFGARIAVSDHSDVLPGVRNYDPEASTGRGLALVATLAAAWGVESDDHGKTVWFELADPEEPDEATDGQGPEQGAGATAGTFTVQLRRASPALVRATLEYGDAVLRELALLALGGALDDALADGWQSPQLDISSILAAADTAIAAGEAIADLELTFPAGAGEAARERLRLIDHADALARDDQLLTAPAVPEIGACRHWIYTQIAEQATGSPAQAWVLPGSMEPVRVAAGLSQDELDRLRTATDAMVVADDANRILFVNGPAGELLGWTPESLAGQRLIAIIPPELREAHLAGFSRLQVTGQPRLLGRTITVPALRRDGLRVEVELTISRIDLIGGRTGFRASLTPTHPGTVL